MNRPSPRRRRGMAPATATATATAIPHDILFDEVLARLPVKCLARFQSVCKMWRAAMCRAPFARRRLELSGATTGLTMAILPHQEAAAGCVNIYSFQPEAGRIWLTPPVGERVLSKELPGGIPSFSAPLHCDGLILIPCSTERIFVCNPTTKEFVELPPGSRDMAANQNQKVALGFDPWSGTYKVARHFLRSRSGDVADVSGYSTGHEILTLGGGGGGGGAEAWEWSPAVDPPYPIKATAPVCLRGFFYWGAFRSVAARRGTGAMVMHHSDVILRFSMRDGIGAFTVHPNPPGTEDSLSANDQLCELGSKLCYAHSSSPFVFAIWLAEEDGQKNLAWELRCRVCLPVAWHPLVLDCSSTEQCKIFLSAHSTCTWYVFECDLRDGSLQMVTNMTSRSVRHGNRVEYITGMSPYSCSLVPFVGSLLRIRPWR